MWIVDSKRRLALTGSENEFASTNIRPEGRPLGEVLMERVTANKDQFDREQEFAREQAQNNDRER